MKPRYPSLKLLFTDTDSFTFEIPTEDLYQDLQDPHLNHHFDISNYPADHPLHSVRNRAVLGKFKDECEGFPANEFIGLRSKMYSIDIHGRDQKNTAAGVKRCVKNRVLKHELYREVLLDRKDVYVTQKTIQSKNHILKTVEQYRVGLSAYDDKRYILEDGIRTLPYGHSLIDDE